VFFIGTGWALAIFAGQSAAQNEEPWPPFLSLFISWDTHCVKKPFPDTRNATTKVLTNRFLLALVRLFIILKIYIHNGTCRYASHAKNT
jgi:hypothetical protein